MNEILEQALPFWESLTDKQKEEIRNNMVKTECQKKTQLHFGGGECAGVQIIGKGRVRGIYYITGRRRYYIIPFAGRRCQYSERGVYA